MISAAVLFVVLSQCPQYVRTKVKDSDPLSQCLYWPENTQIQWRMNAEGAPDTTADTETTAMQKSYATWQAAMNDCGSLSFNQGPATNNRSYGNDGENVIIFRYKLCTDSPSYDGVPAERRTYIPSTDPCWDDENCGNKYNCFEYGPSALAITTTHFSPTSGRILDADIEFSTARFEFTTVDAPPCVKPNYSQNCVASDIQNTATHEIGHVLGLAHTCFAGSTMNPSANPGELSKRTLDVGSKQFVCDVYPKGKPATSCVVRPLSDNLGKAHSGCSAGGGTLGVGLLALLLRRRKTS